MKTATLCHLKKITGALILFLSLSFVPMKAQELAFKRFEISNESESRANAIDYSLLNHLANDNIPTKHYRDGQLVKDCLKPQRIFINRTALQSVLNDKESIEQSEILIIKINSLKDLQFSILLENLQAFSNLKYLVVQSSIDLCSASSDSSNCEMEALRSFLIGSAPASVEIFYQISIDE